MFDDFFCFPKIFFQTINFLKNGFKEKPMIIKRANLFFQDVEKGTISFLNLKKVQMQFNDKNNYKKLGIYLFY